MSVGSLQAIAPVPATAAGYSLLGVAQVIQAPDVPADPPEQSTAEPWEQGVEWAPEQVLGGGTAQQGCLGNTPDGFDDVIQTNPVTNTAEPFVVAAIDKCSTSGWRGRDWLGRARRQLIATQSNYIAHELQYGTLRDAQSLENVALVDGTEITGSTLSAAHALAVAELKVGQAYGGRRAMIHVDPLVLTLLMADHLLTQSGTAWTTPMGNLVVADSGYGPEDTEHFLYVTLLVQIRLGEIIIVPGDSEMARAAATDRATNLTTVIAERLALVTFDNTDADPADLIFKQQVDITHDLSVS